MGTAILIPPSPPASLSFSGWSSSPSGTILDDTQLRREERLLVELVAPLCRFWNREKKDRPPPPPGDGEDVDAREAVSSGGRKKSWSFDKSAPAGLLSVVVAAPFAPLPLPLPLLVPSPVPVLSLWPWLWSSDPGPPFPLSSVCPLATRDLTDASEVADNHPRPTLRRDKRDRFRSASTSSSSSWTFDALFSFIPALRPPSFMSVLGAARAAP